MGSFLLVVRRSVVVGVGAEGVMGEYEGTGEEAELGTGDVRLTARRRGLGVWNGG